MEPGLIAPPVLAVTAPQDSVCPQTSTISRPSAMYQRTRSGEIGAAPVISTRERCTPMALRTLSSTSARASQKASRRPAGTGLRSSRSLAWR